MKHFLALWFISAAALAADEITTITNGLTPAGNRFTIQLVENLRLGPEHGDEFLWPQVGTTVQADDRGNMYVTGAGENRITVIDPSGKFVRYIGGPGQGPGEYQGLLSFQVLADGRAVGFETKGVASSFNWYDKQLNFVEKARLENGIYQAAQLSPNGAIAFTNVIRVDQANAKMKLGWLLKGQKSEPEIELSHLDSPIPSPRIMESSENFAKFLGHMLKSAAEGHLSFAAFNSDNSIYTATAKKYQISHWDANLKKQRVISREYKPIHQGEAEIEAIVDPVLEAVRANIPPNMPHLTSKNTIRKAVEFAGFPSIKHPIGGLATLEDGTLAVVHDISLVHKTMRVDLFDKEGRYIGDFEHTAPGVSSFILVFKKGYLYRIEANEDEENELVRYSYKIVPAS